MSTWKQVLLAGDAVPYTGATAAVDLGSYGLSSSGVIGGTGRISESITLASGDNITAFTGTMLHRTTASATGYATGILFDVRPTVASGQTQSGSMRGVVAYVLRNYDSGAANDQGTLNAIYGFSCSFGHFNTLASGGTTNYVRGLRLSPYGMSGTIGNMVDIIIDPIQSGGTVTTHYAIYQTDTAILNYFGSKIGVGTITTPLEQIHVNDTVRADTAFNLNGTDGLSTTVTLAKLTSGGVNGSLTFTGGILTGKVDPT